MSVEGRTNKAPALFFYHADVKIAVFLSIFAMTIIFRFPQNRPYKAVWGIFLFLMQRYKIFMTLAIKSLDLFELICDYP